MAKRNRMGVETPDMEIEQAVDALFESGNGAKRRTLVIPPINFLVFQTKIIGTTPLVLNKFSEKARQQMRETQVAGSQSRKGTKRAAKNFDECYQQAMHRFADGGCGIPCGCFRWALVTACGLVGFHMTKGKSCLFVLADGNEEDGTPLVRITKGEPRKVEHSVRNESGVADLRARPCWDPGWEATLRIQYDADFFSAEDLMNLTMRAGVQVGIGEGRAYSKKSVGMGWGSFQPESAKEDQKS